MSASHAAFFDRPEARPLKDVLTRPDLLPQYELLSRLELPAVQAAVWDIEPIIATFDAATRTHAIQSSGALIGDLLTARGFRIARDARGEKRRGRVRKARFVKVRYDLGAADAIGSQPSPGGRGHHGRHHGSLPHHPDRSGEVTVEPAWLTVADVLDAHARQLRVFGGAAGIRDEGALESAIERPIDKWR